MSSCWFWAVTGLRQWFPEKCIQCDGKRHLTESEFQEADILLINKHLRCVPILFDTNYKLKL